MWAAGRGCGASGSRCSVPACSLPRSSMNATPPAGASTVPAPDPPRCPSTACAGHAWRKHSSSAPTTAHNAGCAGIVTSSQPRWRPASASPILRIREPRASIIDLPTLCAMGWPPSKSGRVQSTGTSHQHRSVTDRPGPAATTRWPLLNKQHSAYHRTDHAPKPGRRGTSRKQPAPKLIGAA